MQIWKKMILALLAVSIVYIAVVLSFIYIGARAMPASNLDTIVILGSKVIDDPARPMPVLKERLDAAIPLIEEHESAKVIVSGGQGEDETASEASVMKDYLVAHGIEASRIEIEDKSMRTEENLANSKAMFYLGKTVIVTSDYHLYRALMLADWKNIDATGLPAKTRFGALVKGLPREVLSITYAWLFDW